MGMEREHADDLAPVLIGEGPEHTIEVVRGVGQAVLRRE
jgi:hypothetical protein